MSGSVSWFDLYGALILYHERKVILKDLLWIFLQGSQGRPLCTHPGSFGGVLRMSLITHSTEKGRRVFGTGLGSSQVLKEAFGPAGDRTRFFLSP